MKYSKVVVKRGNGREKLDVFVTNGREECYLFTYKFKTSIYKRFRNGVAVNDLFANKPANKNFAVAKFIKRVLELLKFFEKESDAKLFRDKKAFAERCRKLTRSAKRDFADEHIEYADKLCVNF